MSDWNILFVDDEKQILNSLKRMLRSEGYNIFIADNGLEAFQVLSKIKIHIVVSDQRMPGMNGNELLKEVKKLYPNTIRMILSGYADMNVIIESINSGDISQFIPKPWNEEDFKIIIRQALQEYEIQEEIKTFTKQISEQNLELKKTNALLLAASHGIRIELDLFQCACQNLPIGILGITQDDFIVYQNQFAESFFSRNGKTVIGECIQNVFNKTFVKEIKELTENMKKGFFFINEIYGISLKFFIDYFTLKENQFGIIVVFEENL